MPRVNLYATLRDLTGEKSVSVEGKTVREVLRALARRWPALEEELLEDGDVKDGYSIFVNGRDVRYLQGLDTPLSEEDVLDLFPPVAGGGRRSRVFGGVSPEQFTRYLKKWGGKPLEDGWWQLEGARVRFWTEPPAEVGAWYVARLGVEAEGEEAERWWRRIELACLRGGG